MKLRLNDGSLLEVIDNSEDGELFGDEGPASIDDLEKAIGPIIKFAEQTLSQLKENVTPSELEISFGAEAGGEGGFFGLAKVHAKATISVKMKWTP